MRLPATGLALALLALLRHHGLPWLLPLVVANSVVGFVYMHLERAALRDVGSAVLTGRVRVPDAYNLPLNLAVHAVLPALLVARGLRGLRGLRGRRGAAAMGPVAVSRPCTACGVALAVETLLLMALDLGEVYPTRCLPLRHYVAAHVAIVIAWCCVATSSRGCSVRARSSSGAAAGNAP